MSDDVKTVMSDVVSDDVKTVMSDVKTVMSDDVQTVMNDDVKTVMSDEFQKCNGVNDEQNNTYRRGTEVNTVGRSVFMSSRMVSVEPW